VSTVQVKLPKKLIPVFDGEADVRGAYGGRGSAKTRSFAKMTAVRALMFAAAGISGLILCGRQWMNSLSESSFAEIEAAIRSEDWLAAQFDIGEKYIRTKDGRVSYEFVGLTRNIGSVKSKSRILLCWIDEGEDVTQGAMEVLVPTLREEGEGWNAELWVTWNPRRKNSAMDKLRHDKDPRVKIVEMNWRDNPRFPALLERKRVKHLEQSPDTYPHVWEGAYATAIAGAYYAAGLTKARAENRIGRVTADPMLIKRAYADIGGTGARADNFVFWVAQFVGREIRVIDHYEQQGQPGSAHLEWLRSRGHTPGNTQIWLPHDGDTKDKVFDVSYRSAFESAEYTVEVVPNQGRGAAKQRVESARRVFSACLFNEATTEAGVAALGWYHEKIDEERGIGLGPDHDWSSHSADAFGMMCMTYEAPQIKREEEEEAHQTGGWMG
jgi:phage terminase large subunit